MNPRCLLETPENEKRIKELLDNFPNRTILTLKSLINSWMSYNLKENEDRFPTLEELKDWESKLHYDKKLNLAAAFSPVERLNRVNNIRKAFSNIIGSILDSRVESMQQRLDLSTDPQERRELAFNIKNITRASVIKTVRPSEIFQRIKKAYQDYIDTPSEILQKLELDTIKHRNEDLEESMQIAAAKLLVLRKKHAYKKIIDNYQLLVEEAISDFSIREGVNLSVSSDNFIFDTENNDYTNDEVYFSDDYQDSEEIYRDSWITNVREVSTYDNLSNKVRRIISNIVRVNKQGLQELDDLNNTRNLDSSYVFAELINGLRNMVYPTDLIPTLRKMSITKPWVSQIVYSLENDSSLRADFYKFFRKDTLNYWIQTSRMDSNGHYSFKTTSISRTEGIGHYFEEWTDNHEYGITLDPDSIYNSSGDIVELNVSKGLELVNSILNKFPRNAKNEESIKLSYNDSIINPTIKALKMAGISVEREILTDLLDSAGSENESPIKRILGHLRTLYSELANNNDPEKGLRSTDLLDYYSGVFNSIATILDYVTEDIVESNVRQGDKSRYIHVNPSYLTTLIKKFRSDEYASFIDNEYGTVPQFKKGEFWRNTWLDRIRNDKEYRNKLNHIVLLEHNRKEYAKWSNKDTTLALINQYFSQPTSGDTGYAYYPVPVLADSQSAEFLLGPRYIKDFRFKLLDKFAEVIKQEIDRIILVTERFNKGVREIANYDIIKRKDGTIIPGGSEFKMFPELNLPIWGENSNMKFIDVYNNMIDNPDVTTETIDKFIRVTVGQIMDANYIKLKDYLKQIGLLDRVSEANNAQYVYFDKYSEASLDKMLEEWFWNTSYATSQIIQILTGDLAFYKNIEDFCKRAKQFHAPAQRLDTYAEWDGKPVLERVPMKDSYGNPILDSSGNTIEVPRNERTMFLKDLEKAPQELDEIEAMLDSKIAEGFLSKEEKNVILGVYKKTNVADAQAYRSLDSYRTLCIMAGLWSDTEETAFNHFERGEWHAEDFVVLWGNIKPYLYTQVNQDNQVDGNLIRVPMQNKNSETLLLTNSIFGKILSSGKLRALEDFMKNHSIDIVQFESAVKVGKQDLVDINNISDDDYNSTMNTLEGALQLNSNIIKEYSYNDYGIQTNLPEHGIDAQQLVGTQISRLITADMSEDIKFDYQGREFSKAEWTNLYNAVKVATIVDSNEKLSEELSSPDKVSELLLEELKGNARYGVDLQDAVKLNKDGKFTIPLNDPSRTLQLQTLLNSVIKNRVTKQKSQGGAFVQVSAYGLKRKPQVVFNKDHSIKYIEAYIQCPSKELYDLLVDNGSHEIDINKKFIDDYGKERYIVPRKYLNAIGYRIPTEDKYSMVPIKIIGFLPRQVGSVIILPELITSMSGSDYDADKIYVMFHSLNIEHYNKSLAWYDYNKASKGNKIFLDRIMGIDSSDIETSEEFDVWFDHNKENYRYKIPIVNTVSLNIDKNLDLNNPVELYNNLKNKSKLQRDSLMIDLMYLVLTNKDTVGRLLNPGGFIEQKRTARAITVLNNLSLDEFKSVFGTYTEFLSRPLESSGNTEGLESIAQKYKEELNPLSPETWVTLHQRNMSGASLIGIAANHNSSHAFMQHTDLSVKNDYKLTINGHKYESLHNIKNNINQYISRNVSGFLAAFVDNAKDPIAGSLNFNSYTADIAFTLLRLGVPVMETCLILNQPIVIETVTNSLNKNTTMNSSLKRVLDYYIDKALKEPVKGSVVSPDDIGNYNFTSYELISNILASHNPSFSSNNIEEVLYYSNQVKVGYLLDKLIGLSTDVGLLTQATRSDTQGGAIGPSNAVTTVKLGRIRDVFGTNSKITTLTGADFISLSEQTPESIMNSKLPILAAFTYYGIIQPISILSMYFPNFNDSYQAIIEKFKENSKYGRLSAKTINSIYNDIVPYYFSYFDSINYQVPTQVETTEEGDKIIKNISPRDYYINYFPREFEEFKTNNKYTSRLPFIRNLKVIHKNANSPTDKIILSSNGKLTPIKREQYIKDWESMLYKDDLNRDMARKLFVYTVHRVLGFSPKSFGSLVPTAIKLDNKNYITTLQNLIEGGFAWEVFYDQYVRNHLNNRELVPSIKNTTIGITSDTISFNVKLDNFSNEDMRQFAHPYKWDEEINYFRYIHFNYRGKDLYFELSSTDSTEGATYIKTKPLGELNNYIEYEYDTPMVESVISTQKTNNMNDYYNSNADIDTEIPMLPDYTRYSPFDIPGEHNTRESNLSKLNDLSPKTTDDYTNQEYCK